MDKISINAYAKINITLDVIKKRDDGYHELEMIMQSIDVYDDVEIKKNSGGINVFCDSKIQNLNTAYIAAKKIIDKYDMSYGVDIYIKKRVPIAAGLAGGSADAAAVIKGMRKLFFPQMSIYNFYDLASSIGKDVPFCIKNGTAFAYGLGDKLVYTNKCPHFYVTLVKPDIYVSTAEVYKALNINNIKLRPDTKRVLKAIEENDKESIAKGTVNVLETVTAVREPVIYKIKQALINNGAISSAMSGSGPSVYGLFLDKQKADAAAEYIKSEFGFKEVFSTQTINP